MKKIPTLFERVFENNRVVGITDKVAPGMEWVMEDEGTATIKYDGACCAIINGQFYRRYDAKPGRKIPNGAIPCCPPDPVTGHWPHWVLVDFEKSEDRWFAEALINSQRYSILDNATYEAVGPHFQGNPYDLPRDYLFKHGSYTVDVPRTFDGIRSWLEGNRQEGLVFWRNGEPQCKIKRTDFGFPWPVKEDAPDET